MTRRRGLAACGDDARRLGAWVVVSTPRPPSPLLGWTLIGELLDLLSLRLDHPQQPVALGAQVGDLLVLFGDAFAQHRNFRAYVAGFFGCFLSFTGCGVGTVSGNGHRVNTVQLGR